MPQQLYLANVVFGANITGYFPVAANTLQEAATNAARIYDQNTTVTYANGVTSSFGSATRINAAGSNNASITVFVKDPAAPLVGVTGIGGANSYQFNVVTTAITVPTVATYAPATTFPPSVPN